MPWFFFFFFFNDMNGLLTYGVAQSGLNHWKVVESLPGVTPGHGLTLLLAFAECPVLG